ncbi:MAG: hypothetical protein EOP06_23615 [Proteobacteria bacterium]|nr:MAG: hypothetical protein EOP06_23615 [Pseudomonadota bacterium]
MRRQATVALMETKCGLPDHSSAGARHKSDRDFIILSDNLDRLAWYRLPKFAVYIRKEDCVIFAVKVGTVEEHHGSVAAWFHRVALYELVGRRCEMLALEFEPALMSSKVTGRWSNHVLERKDRHSLKRDKPRHRETKQAYARSSS